MKRVLFYILVVGACFTKYWADFSTAAEDWGMWYVLKHLWYTVR